MLTIDILKSNPALSSLTDDQFAAVAQLSANDEDRVIANKLKEVHDQYDRDIKEATGKDKPGGVKTYDHLKSVLKDLTKSAGAAEGAKALQDKVAELETTKTKLEKQLADGSGDTTLKTRIAELEKRLGDKTSEVDQVKKALSTEMETLKAQLSEKESQIRTTTVASDIDSYILAKGVKFNDTIPENILNETLTYRRKSFLESINVDNVDDGKGGKRTVVRDEKGEIMRNPENGLEPYTPGELFVKNHVSDLIKEGKQQAGAGTSAPSEKRSTLLDLSGAKSQIVADEIIVKHIMQNEGIAKTDPRFGERQSEIRTENKVADLPIRE